MIPTKRINLIYNLDKLLGGSPLFTMLDVGMVTWQPSLYIEQLQTLLDLSRSNW